MIHLLDCHSLSQFDCFLNLNPFLEVIHRNKLEFIPNDKQQKVASAQQKLNMFNQNNLDNKQRQSKFN